MSKKPWSVFNFFVRAATVDDLPVVFCKNQIKNHLLDHRLAIICKIAFRYLRFLIVYFLRFCEN
jgi:hypothetical protein